eukprot:scaffold80752_cov69-Cyclotella_meneghiniana.AAC.2
MNVYTTTMFYLFLTLMCLVVVVVVDAFCPVNENQTRRHAILFASGDGFSKEGEPSTSEKKKKPKGDSIRSETGIRPSLNPVTINCISEALLIRSKQTKDTNIDTAAPGVEPIQIAITAGGIAMKIIEQRKSAAETDETTDIFTMEESNVISGRVVGVVMRMRELEQVLRSKVSDAEYVYKYGEEMSFGLLKSELKLEGDSEAVISDELEKELSNAIKINPLLRMNRAECLLALFIETVERPKLELLGEEVAGGSEVDFIDTDRLEVLTKA